MKPAYPSTLGLLMALWFTVPTAQAQAGPNQPCLGPECLICPALSDPQQYAEGGMKIMRFMAPGRGSWLFRSDVDLTTDFGMPAHMEPELARLISTFNRQGTEVAIVIQPTRGLMHRDKVRPDFAYGFDYAEGVANLRHFLTQLRNAGAIVPDVMNLVENPPQEEYFFRRDTHWTPAGAKATAQLVAQEVRRQPVYAGLTKSTYRTEPSVIIPKDGAHNMAFSRLCGNDFGYQYVQNFQTVPEVDEVSALFDDIPEPEVTLVGTSNSAARDEDTKQYNFDGYLKEYLSVNLMNFSLQGGGQDGALMEFLLSPSYSPSTPPKLIIWELPANYKLASEVMYRQLVPAAEGGCAARTTVLSGRAERSGYRENDRIEVLSNSGAQRQALTGADGVLDIKMSDRDLRNFYVIVYYDNGSRDKVWIRRPGIVSGGQYYLELSKAAEFRNANLLSVFIEPTQASDKPIDLEVSLCR
mgnify:CR=1 FL=1